MVLNSFDGNGYKLPDEVEDQLEAYVRQSADNELPRPTVMALVPLSTIATWLISMLTLYATQSIHP